MGTLLLVVVYLHYILKIPPFFGELWIYLISAAFGHGDSVKTAIILFLKGTGMDFAGFLT